MKFTFISHPGGTVMDDMTTTDIAIIGCGASGTVTLHYLVEYYERMKLPHPPRIYIFEKSKDLGLGIAYSTRNDEHILNMRNGTIDIFSDKPGDFMDWLNMNAARLGLTKKETAFDAFLPRRIVGLYLQENLHRNVSRAKQLGISVTFIQEEITDFHELGSKYRLRFNASSIDVDYAVFCLGNLPSTNYPQLYDVPTYFHSPWELDAKIKSSAKPIGILGASLTAVDTLLSLAPRTTGPLYFIAPTGRLPKVLHIKRPFTPEFVTKETIAKMTDDFTRKLTLREVILLFKKEIETATGGPVDWKQLRQVDDDPVRALQTDIARAENGENHWHTVLADTSPLLPLIWGNLRERDKKRFYHYYYHWWRIYRVSMPLQNAKKVLRLLESGRLKIIRGVRSVTYDQHTKQFSITYKQHEHAGGQLHVPYLVDGTGTGFDITKSQSPLIQHMITNGLLVPHPMGGATVNHETLQLVRQTGTEIPRAFFFGMLTKGVHFYTNALDANAAHAEQVARTVIRDMRESSEPPTQPPAQ